MAAVLEGDRMARQPIRLILLKARQWGGSTLVQMYMAWIQSCLRRDWNSLICAHVKDAASGIRGMYTKLLDNYPADLWDGDEKPQFKPYERTCNVRQIVGRGCRVTIGSSENQDAVRGADYAMAHLSETAFWASTPQRSPQGFIQAVCGAITLQPDTLVAVESTANGVGNYFHTEWLRCKEGRGDKHAVFVPWYEIEIYRLAPPSPEAVAATLDDYERRLWDMGLALDQVYWYRRKAAEYGSLDQMHAEFPTDDVEAFLNSGSGVFSPACVEALRKGCCKPGAVGGLDRLRHGLRCRPQGLLVRLGAACAPWPLCGGCRCGWSLGKGRLVGNSRAEGTTAGPARGRGAVARPRRPRHARPQECSRRPVLQQGTAHYRE